MVQICTNYMQRSLSMINQCIYSVAFRLPHSLAFSLLRDVDHGCPFDRATKDHESRVMRIVASDRRAIRCCGQKPMEFRWGAGTFDRNFQLRTHNPVRTRILNKNFWFFIFLLWNPRHTKINSIFFNLQRQRRIVKNSPLENSDLKENYFTTI